MITFFVVNSKKKKQQQQTLIIMLFIIAKKIILAKVDMLLPASLLKKVNIVLVIKYKTLDIHIYSENDLTSVGSHICNSITKTFQKLA